MSGAKAEVFKIPSQEELNGFKPKNREDEYLKNFPQGEVGETRQEKPFPGFEGGEVKIIPPIIQAAKEALQGFDADLEENSNEPSLTTKHFGTTVDDRSISELRSLLERFDGLKLNDPKYKEESSFVAQEVSRLTSGN